MNNRVGSVDGVSLLSRPVVALLSLLLAVMLAACGGDSADTGSDDEADASSTATGETVAVPDELASGEVLFYTSMTPGGLEPLIAAFESENPDVAVEPFRLTTGDLIARYDQEASAGRVAASVMCHTNQTWFRDNADTLKEFSSEVLLDLPEEGRLLGLENVVSPGAEVAQVVYNTEVFEEPPSSWEDLLDPAFQGQVSVIDPGGTAVFYEWYAGVADGIGDELPTDFVERLAALDPVLHVSGTPQAQAVAAGELAWGSAGWGAAVAELQEQGAPVGSVALYPVYVAQMGCVIPQDAPNPEGGEAFLSWLLSEEGQKVYTSPTGTSALQHSFVYPDLETSIPLPEDVTVRYSHADEIEPRLSELEALFREITGG